MDNTDRKKELLHDQFEARPLRHRVESSSHLQRQGKRVWNHLRRDAQEQLATEVLWVELEATAKKKRAREALDKIFEYEALICELDPEEPASAERLLRSLPEEARDRGERALEALRKNPIFKGKVSAVIGSENPGPAEVNPLRGKEFSILDYGRVLAREVAHHGIRQRTARAMVIMLDQDRRIPVLKDGEWLHRISTVENHALSKTEGRGAGDRKYDSEEGLLGIYERVLRHLRETAFDEPDRQEVEAKVTETIRPLVEKDLERVVERGLTMRTRLKEEYQRNREAVRHHTTAGDHFVHMREQLGRVREALRLLRRFDELHPEWGARARLVRERLRKNPIGANLVLDVTRETDKYKSHLFEKRNELDARSATRTVLKRSSETPKTLPEWEKAREQIFGGKRPDIGPEGIDHRRCRALARLEPENFPDLKEAAEAVADMIGDPQTDSVVLGQSLKRLKLKSGKTVFFTVERHATDQDKQKKLRKSIERSRQWCDENGVPQ